MNINLIFMFDIILTIFPLAFALRLWLLRKKPVPYKAGSEMHDAYIKSTSRPRIILSLLVAVVFGVKSIFDINQIARQYGDSALPQVGFLLAFLLLIGASVAYAVYSSTKPKN